MKKIAFSTWNDRTWWFYSNIFVFFATNIERCQKYNYYKIKFIHFTFIHFTHYATYLTMDEY